MKALVLGKRQECVPDSSGTPIHSFSYFESAEALPDGLPAQSLTSEAFGSLGLPRDPVSLFLRGLSLAPGRADG